MVVRGFIIGPRVSLRVRPEACSTSNLGATPEVFQSRVSDATDDLRSSIDSPIAHREFPVGVDAPVARRRGDSGVRPNDITRYQALSGGGHLLHTNVRVMAETTRDLELDVMRLTAGLTTAF